MTLDPPTKAFIDAAQAIGATPYHQMDSADEARAAFRQVAMARSGGGTAPGGTECSVEEIRLGDNWCRVYRPIERSVHEGPMPLVMFIHGGGWVLGDLDTHDVQARAFAALPATVVSVEYRLAPEHPYPAAHEDCWDWLQFVAEGMGDWTHTDRLVVAGDSAGGLLAASMAQRCRDVEGAPELAAQCLIYPLFDVEMDSPSHERNGEGYLLTRDLTRWFLDSYAPGEGFSPTELDDLSGLAPAVIATAGYDPLADDGITYGNRLRDAGVPVSTLHFDGLVHGFFGMGGLSPSAAAAISATVGGLRGLLDASR
jgi:acetyl esterase